MDKLRRTIRWCPPSKCLSFWHWVYWVWPITPVINGYTRVGTGLYGWRFLGLEFDYDERPVSHPNPKG